MTVQTVHQSRYSGIKLKVQPFVNSISSVYILPEELYRLYKVKTTDDDRLVVCKRKSTKRKVVCKSTKIKLVFFVQLTFI